jgi:hypothetical protein
MKQNFKLNLNQISLLALLFFASACDPYKEHAKGNLNKSDYCLNTSVLNAACPQPSYNSSKKTLTGKTARQYRPVAPEAMIKQ